MLRSRLSKFTRSDWFVCQKGWREGLKSHGGLLRVIVVSIPRLGTTQRFNARGRANFKDGQRALWRQMEADRAEGDGSEEGIAPRQSPFDLPAITHHCRQAGKDIKSDSLPVLLRSPKTTRTYY
ncbi:MAG TPA: hypothetical protein VI260_26320 [Blastocatellia bacterium]|jgi:hypothetical protein